jgi:endonuclease YncB( thermonuclease family)
MDVVLFLLGCLGFLASIVLMIKGVRIGETKSREPGIALCFASVFLFLAGPSVASTSSVAVIFALVLMLFAIFLAIRGHFDIISLHGRRWGAALFVLGLVLLVFSATVIGSGNSNTRSVELSQSGNPTATGQAALPAGSSATKEVTTVATVEAEQTETITITPAVQRTTTPTPTPTVTPTPKPETEIWDGTVTFVEDGDTVLLDNGQKVDYIGIKAPQQGQRGYQQAADRNKQLVLNKRVRLEVYPRQLYSLGGLSPAYASTAAGKAILDSQSPVLLAYVWVGDQLVNNALVRDGWAASAPTNDLTKWQWLLDKSQGEAQAQPVGVWAPEPTPTPTPAPTPTPTPMPTPTPTPMPQPTVAPQPATFLVYASSQSDVYHLGGCRYVKRIKYLITFNSPSEAIASGYRPCKVCQPPTTP